MKKAIILARVSTEDQLNEGMSIPAQIEKARAYANAKDLKILSEYQFDESSLKDHRIKFNKVLEEIEKLEEEVVLIVETIDRLQRSFKESVILDDYRKQGKLEIHFLRENLIIHKNSNSSEIQRWDLGVFLAKSYVLQISDNVKRSIEHKLKNGEWPGKAPYGYINKKREDGKNWVYPNSFESRIVKRIYELYATRSYSMNEIIRELSKTFNISLHKGKLDAIMKNPFYYGVMRYDKNLYPHRYKPIISKDLFDTVQEIKKEHGKKHFKFAGLPYLYRGLIKCAQCGCMFTPEKKKGKYIYYHCTEYYGKHKTSWIREERLTEKFAEIFKGLHIPKDIAAGIAKTLKESHQGKVEYQKNLYSDLNIEYQKYETRIEKMYEDRLDGCITQDMYDRKHKEYRAKQDGIKQKMNNLQLADEEYYITASYILSLANRAYDLFLSSEPMIKRQLLKLLLQNCEIYNGSLRFSLNYPFSAIFSYTKSQNWLLGQDSNLQPSGYKSPKISFRLGLSHHPLRLTEGRVSGASPGLIPEYELTL